MKKKAIKSIIYGIELVEEIKGKIDIVYGIGNTTQSSAIVSVITGSEFENLTGRGQG
jgi:nicotinate-nucleotide--dimethylbenzimidazole phosphoribosyltransferase